MTSHGVGVSLGKFPFEYTEQQVLEIAKRVGPVVSVKLLFDDMTGKSKGYATVVYEDKETATSAVRNLDYLTIQNGRFIRCSFANESSTIDNLPIGSLRLPPLPLGIQIHSNQPATLVISNVLANIDPKSGFQILSEMKLLSKNDPKLAVELLAQFPQLSHALVELSLLSNTSNRDLIQLTLNQKAHTLRQVTIDHAKLLKEIAALSEEDILTLDSDKQNVLIEMQQKIQDGLYGDVMTLG